MRARAHGNVSLRAIGGRGATDVPHFIGDGARRYEIIREISRGGMGTVHLGTLRGPLGFAKLVAIKTMHAQDVADPHVAAMFAAEARLTAQLCHANIVSTLDVLVQHGSVFIVMEYIDGRPLSQLVATAFDIGHVMPVEVACAIMHDVLLGLDHAHSAGVIHCDVSPENVLVGTDGLSRIVDFGIAKVASSARESKHDVDNTEVRGKVPYMAPEQLRGTAVDQRIDLYAAGITLWEMLTGRRLFHGANRAQIIANVLGGHVDPPSRRGATVPRALDALVLKATARDPRARFRSAREMANALAAAVPLASREEVVASMMRIDYDNTPGSGIRALSDAELAVRRHARAARNHVPTCATMDELLPPPLPPPAMRSHRSLSPDQSRPQTPPRRSESNGYLRIRLAVVCLLGITVGIALGLGQMVHGMLPLERWWSSAADFIAPPPRPKPPSKPVATAPPTTPTTPTTAMATVTTPAAPPPMPATAAPPKRLPPPPRR